jgi:hypothetical protein
LMFTTYDATNCNFNQVRVPPNIFQDLKGAEKLKRLKKLA